MVLLRWGMVVLRKTVPDTWPWSHLASLTSAACQSLTRGREGGGEERGGEERRGEERRGREGGREGEGGG
eukprot:1343015-Rhodomonas_salina.2